VAYDDRSFPFWRMVLAVALGSLLAMAISWAVGLALVKLAADQALHQLNEQARLAEAKRIENEQVRQHEAAVRRQQEAEAAAKRDPRPLLKQGTDAMPSGTTACMFGYRSVKLADGRWQQLLRGGQAQPCRTN
jgi:hypothetical protein